MQPLAAAKKPPLQPVNLNTATAHELLQQVPGLGPSMADKILKMRKAFGPFKSVDDLRGIKGIAAKCLARMSKYRTVGKAAAAKKPASPSLLPERTSRRKIPRPKSRAGLRLYVAALQNLVRLFPLFDTKRYLVGDVNPVALEGHHFFRMIGQHPNVF